VGAGPGGKGENVEAGIDARDRIPRHGTEEPDPVPQRSRQPAENRLLRTRPNDDDPRGMLHPRGRFEEGVDPLLFHQPADIPDSQKLIARGVTRACRAHERLHVDGRRHHLGGPPVSLPPSHLQNLGIRAEEKIDPVENSPLDPGERRGIALLDVLVGETDQKGRIPPPPLPPDDLPHEKTVRLLDGQKGIGSDPPQKAADPGRERGRSVAGQKRAVEESAERLLRWLEPDRMGKGPRPASGRDEGEIYVGPDGKAAEKRPPGPHHGAMPHHRQSHTGPSLFRANARYSAAPRSFARSSS